MALLPPLAIISLPPEERGVGETGTYTREEKKSCLFLLSGGGLIFCLWKQWD